MKTLFHPGEIEAQTRYGSRVDNDSKIESFARKLFKTAIDDETAYFIEGQAFFFIATADTDGHCDCSFKGADPAGTRNGVLVEDSHTLVFPDYSGNGLFNTLGNILVNPNAGLLFIDFSTGIRLRVNGKAHISDNVTQYTGIWPNIKRLVIIKVATVYGNCSRNIPQLR